MVISKAIEDDLDDFQQSMNLLKVLVDKVYNPYSNLNENTIDDDRNEIFDRKDSNPALFKGLNQYIIRKRSSLKNHHKMAYSSMLGKLNTSGK